MIFGGSTRWITTAGFAAALLYSASPAFGQCKYDVTIIQAEVCGAGLFAPTAANSLNEAGDVVGFFSDCLGGGSNHPYVFNADEGMIALDLPPEFASGRAKDISDDGVIVGQLGGVITRQVAFIWCDGDWTIVSPDPGGGRTFANAVNSSLQVVGSRDIDAISATAFRWDDGVLDELGGREGVSSQARDINESGAATGWIGSSPLGEGTSAFLWSDGDLLELGPIPGGFQSQAYGINSHDVIVGQGQIADPEFQFGKARAFLWENGRMVDLGLLPGLKFSSALDINDDGVVVGASWDSNLSAGVIWVHGRMLNLNDLLIDGGGLVVKEAWAINEAGQIAASGSLQSEAVGILLTPQPSPIGDLDMDCIVGPSDLLVLLGQWGVCERCAADLNGDGSVNASDLIILLGNWG